MAQPASPLTTQDRLTLIAPGYVKGTLGSYAGLHVRSSGGHAAPIDQKFHTGSFFNDLLMAWFSVRRSVLGNNSGGFGEGLTVDVSVDNYIVDYVATNNT